VRKSLDETVVINGDRRQLLERCRAAMDAGGFSKVTVNDALFQISGRYRKATTVGALTVTLRPAPGGTELAMRATGNVDNVFALFRGPSQRILQAFKSHL
jgi:hypothetical protein